VRTKDFGEFGFQIDKLATDIVMQAASGSYKPMNCVSESVAEERMDTDAEQQSIVASEPSADVFTSCVCLCHAMLLLFDIIALYKWLYMPVITRVKSLNTFCVLILSYFHD